MVWYLVVGLLGIGLIFSGLADVAAALLLLLRQAVEDVAGERAAGIVMLLVLVAGHGGGAYYLYKDPTSSSAETALPSGTSHEARGSAPTHRATQDKSKRHVVTLCGNGDAPEEIDLRSWTAYRCTTIAQDGCLSWDAYSSRPDQGCPGRKLCCPGTTANAAPSEALP